VSKVSYNRGDEILEVTIRDTSGARIEVRRSNISDERENGRILSWLINKWGLKFKYDKSLLDIDNDFFKY
jgi:hypothetical protein